MTPDEFAALTPCSRVRWAGAGNERLPGTVVTVTADGIAVRWDDDHPGCRPAEYLGLDAGSLRLWPVPEPPPEPPGCGPGGGQPAAPQPDGGTPKPGRKRKTPLRMGTVRVSGETK